MFLLIFIILILLIVAEWIYTISKKPCPGISGIPFFHSLLQQNKNLDDLYNFLHKKTFEYGKTFSTVLHIGAPWYIVSSDPEVFDHFLRKNFEYYEKSELMLKCMNRSYLGNGIFVANGDTWNVQRKISSKMFKKRLLKGFFKSYDKHSKEVLELMEKQEGKEVDMQTVFNAFTLDTFCEIAFDYDCGSLRQGGSKFQIALDTVNNSVSQRFFNPLWEYLPFIKTEKDFATNIKIVDEIIYDIIDKRQKLVDEGKEFKTDDFLGLYMSSKDENGQPFTRLYLRDVIMNLLLAGKDTTGQTLTWCFKYLAENASVVKKIREELENVNKNEEGEYDYESLEKCEYIKAVISETLRLAPPVPIDDKACIKEDTLPGGIKVRPGDMVAWSAWSFGRQSDYWEDPLKFKPERWIGENGKQNPGLSLYQQIPFQLGPRACLGRNLAIHEASVAIASILSHFDFLPTEKSVNVKTKIGLTLAAEEGMFLIPKRLSNNK